jgi:hypothetical protein
MMIDRKAIEAALLKEHSKAQSVLIRARIGGDAASFGKLWEIIKAGEPPLPQRAAWTFGHCVEEEVSLLPPIVDEVVNHLLNRSDEQHVAVRRNLLRALSLVDCLPEHAGHLFDRCLLWIGESSPSAAIRVYAMEIAGRIAMPYPELRAEVIEAIESNGKDAAMSFRSRARKVLAKLRSEQHS